MMKYPALFARSNLMTWGYGMRSFSSINYSDPKNPRVFMEISRDGKSVGKMVFEVSLL